jgi:hypothetical protein
VNVGVIVGVFDGGITFVGGCTGVTGVLVLRGGWVLVGVGVFGVVVRVRLGTLVLVKVNVRCGVTVLTGTSGV